MSGPPPLTQQSTEERINIALARSVETLQEDTHLADQLQTAMHISREDALRQQSEANLRQAMEQSKVDALRHQSVANLRKAIEQSHMDEQMRIVMAESRRLALQQSLRASSNISANVEQLQTAIALSQSLSENKAWTPPPTWAKGVGTAFEILSGSNTWTPITHPDIIDQLGRLAACNPVTEVEYSAGGATYKTTMRDDGMLSQLDPATGATQLLRLVPFFFEYEASRGQWKAVTQPEAIHALTAVLASSMPRTYRCSTELGEQRYTTKLVNEQGLMLQRNNSSGTTRAVRATPVGPDGAPHFEYLEHAQHWRSPGLSSWSPVSREAARMLARCAAGQGDCHYGAGGQTYRATLTADGFIDQINESTRAVRPIRPAPWLGHGQSRITDSTDGWVPMGEPVAAPVAAPVAVPVAPTPPTAPRVSMATPINLAGWAGPLYGADGQPIAMPSMQPAANFFMPAAVPMGTTVDPVAVPMGSVQNAIPLAPTMYYYQPQSDDSVPMGTALS
jgi:hypothetical protein